MLHIYVIMALILITSLMKHSITIETSVKFCGSLSLVQMNSIINWQKTTECTIKNGQITTIIIESDEKKVVQKLCSGFFNKPQFWNFPYWWIFTSYKDHLSKH